MKYAIVDIETTGLRPSRNRITEIGIVLFDGKEILETFTSLFNPDQRLPAGISEMTGITQDMLDEAPRFYEEARRIAELTEGAIFVGHNVRFDYSFLVEEFKRLGYSYRRQKLCTLQLMRKYFPGLPSYSLGRLIRQFDIRVKARHRALDDALATTQLLQLILEKESEPEAEFIRSHRRNSMLPEHWDIDYLNSLPEACGLYYMTDAEGQVLYVGKSVNIRKRIIQHFNQKTTKAARMQRLVHQLHWELTGNELMALLLESKEIKRLSPPLNRAQRHKTYTKAIHLYENAKGYLCLQVVQAELQKQRDFSFQKLPWKKISTEKEQIIAEFPTASQARRFLQRLAAEHDLCSRLCGLEKGNGPCFAHQLKRCAGACCGKERPPAYNQRLQQALDELLTKQNQTRFALIEKGREEDEHCLILVKGGHPLGYAYLHQDELDNALKNPEEYVTPLPLHPENRGILFRYLQKNEKEMLLV